MTKVHCTSTHLLRSGKVKLPLERFKVVRIARRHQILSTRVASANGDTGRATGAHTILSSNESAVLR